MSIKSACLACIAIAIFYIAVSNDDEYGFVVGQQDTFNNNSSNLRRLSLIDPKTVETRQAIVLPPTMMNLHYRPYVSILSHQDRRSILTVLSELPTHGGAHLNTTME